LAISKLIPTLKMIIITTKCLGVLVLNDFLAVTTNYEWWRNTDCFYMPTICFSFTTN